MRWRVIVLGLLVAVWPAGAEANVIWPAAILTERSLAWWIVPLSLLIEAWFVRRAFGLSWRDTAWATLAANGLSAGVGLFLVPLLGILFAAGLYTTGIAAAIEWQDFSPADWAATFLMAVAANLALELAVFRYGFKLAVDRRAAVLILIANLVTVALVLASLEVVPHEHY